MGFIKVEQGVAHYAEVTLEPHPSQACALSDEQPAIRLGGTFMIADGDIRLKLVRFDEYFHVGEYDHLIARTEQNWQASLYDIVLGKRGQRGHTDQVVYYQEILVNTALVAWQAWKPEYKARRSIYRVPGADYLLRHWPTFEGLANNHFGRSATPEAVNASIPKGQVRVFYNASGNMDSDYPKEVWPVIELELDEAVSLEDMRREVITFIRFVSCACSQTLRVDEQIVSRLSHAEWMAAIGQRLNPVDYSVYYYQEKREPVANPRIHGAFAFLNDDEERDAFVACLTEWFVRNAEWEGAASAMMEAFALEDVMNPTRLLNVTKWIEATPGTKSEQAMEESHVLALSSLLSRHAVAFGYAKLLGRLKNSLRRITREQNTARFTRLVAELKAVFGSQVVGDDLAAWVAEAFTLRGKAAHGPILRQTDAEYELFAKAVHAAECFAYLMIIRDLPMTEKGRKRAASSALVEGYRSEIKDSWPKDLKGRR